MDERQRELASGLLFVFDPTDPEHAQAAADFLKTALDALDSQDRIHAGRLLDGREWNQVPGGTSDGTTK